MFKQKRALLIVPLVLLLGALLASCGSAGAPTPAASTSSTATSAPVSSGSAALDGQALMQECCSVCHSLTRIENARHTANEWQIIVDRMIAKGAQLSTQEEQVLVDYLAQTYK